MKELNYGENYLKKFPICTFFNINNRILYDKFKEKSLFHSKLCKLYKKYMKSQAEFCVGQYAVLDNIQIGEEKNQTLRHKIWIVSQTIDAYSPKICQLGPTSTAPETVALVLLANFRPDHTRPRIQIHTHAASSPPHRITFPVILGLIPAQFDLTHSSFNSFHTKSI